ncbi:MAG: diguanylate cyclase [Planctomycetota bacterium]|nr:diguanylate cyclase [Planctomycetota bacterium]
MHGRSDGPARRGHGADAHEVAARIVVLGPGGAFISALGRDRVTVGRDPESGIVLEGPDVSRQHCVLEPLPGGGHEVVDLGSTNGVLINDRRVSRMPLERFDRLRVGEYDLVYLDGETDAARVMDLLRPPSTSTVADDLDEQGSLRDRLLWLILMTQELRCEEDTNAVLDTLLEELLRWTRHERVLLVLDGGGPLEVGRARNLEPRHLLPDALVACRPLVFEALRQGRAVHGTTPLAGEGGTLCVPIVDRSWTGSERRRTYAGQVRAALLLGRGERLAPRELEPEDLRLLRALTRQVATLLANARLHRQATTDALTQLASRACIEQALRQELEAARVRRQPLAVVLLDVDDFKRINDTLGHEVGDEVLAALAHRVTRVLRHDDAAGRWGGEELLLVLPATDLEGGLIAARKVVAQVSERPLAREVKATVSAGVAAFPGHGATAEALVRAADVALYAAKGLGKNRAEVYAGDVHTVALRSAPPVRRSAPPTGAEATRQQRAVVIGGLQPPPPHRDSPTIRALRPPRETPPTADLTSNAVAWLQCDLLASVPLPPGVLTLGRAEGCDVVLPHPLVSRRHATVHVGHEGGLELEDHSTNGSVLNGERLLGRASLRAGDRLAIGPFEFEVVERDEGERANEKTARVFV